MSLTIVLLPGLDGTGNLFRSFVAELKQEFDIILVRYPPDQLLGYQELTSFAASHLPADRPFVLLAESFSGPIAIALAASKPIGLRAVIFCASFAQNPKRGLRYFFPVVRWLLLRWRPKRLASLFLLNHCGRRDDSTSLVNTITKLSGAVLIRRIESIATIDVAGLIKQIDVPVLYLRATRDRVIPAKAILPFMNAKDFKLVKVKGPHLLLQAVSAQAANAVREFLRSSKGF